MLRDLPIFGVCGHSGSGKTTLIEALIPRLAARGLSVAVAKFHAHGIQVDREGKDSDRFFRTGADVWLEGPDQGFLRTRPVPQEQNVRRLVDFTRRCDVVLLEGRKQIDCWKVWLLGEDETVAPDDAG
ncbi:MAG TPA: molybdopterin-guanine dinucleotide biosynthesis protein B, partial [Planctomycetota bacterium]|nr:molybdopterin-guanine dinucleotide biosynthesis protein B [Planctomycetota bacterium]